MKIHKQSWEQIQDDISNLITLSTNEQMYVVKPFITIGDLIKNYGLVGLISYYKLPLTYQNKEYKNQEEYIDAIFDNIYNEIITKTYIENVNEKLDAIFYYIGYKDEALYKYKINEYKNYLMNRFKFIREYIGMDKNILINFLDFLDY